MGRDNVFPERVFGYVHPKWRTPALNVIMVGIVVRCRRAVLRFYYRHSVN